jgi:hypothetical protein
MPVNEAGEVIGCAPIHGPLEVGDGAEASDVQVPQCTVVSVSQQ